MRQTRVVWANLQRDAEREYRRERNGPKSTTEQLNELKDLASRQTPPEQIQVERYMSASHARRKRHCLIYPLVSYEERSGLEKMSRIQRKLGDWCRDVEEERQRLGGSFREVALKLEDAGLTPAQRLAQMKMRIPDWEAVVNFCSYFDGSVHRELETERSPGVLARVVPAKRMFPFAAEIKPRCGKLGLLEPSMRGPMTVGKT